MMVSRYEPNFDPSAPPLERGNDLALLDLHSGTLVDRIDLSEGDISPSSTSLGEGAKIYARPDRLTRVGTRVVVGLARLSASFMEAGPGAVAVVDPMTKAVSLVDLSPLRNCGSVKPFDDEPDRVAVLCSGATFVDAAGRRPGSGIAVLRVTSTEVSIEETWRASDHPETTPPSHGLVPLEGSRVFAAASGDGGGEGDQALLMDLMAGEAEVLFESSAPFTIGQGAFDRERQLLLIPDAERGVRRFQAGAGMEEATTVDVSPCRRQPAREISRLLPPPT